MSTELHLYRKFQSFPQGNYLLALSGGMDSVLLGEFLHRKGPFLWTDRRGWAVAHVHHSPQTHQQGGGSREIQGFRDSCHQFCQNLSLRWGVPFLSNLTTLNINVHFGEDTGNNSGRKNSETTRKVQIAEESEEHLRQLRWNFLNQWRESNFQWRESNFCQDVKIEAQNSHSNNRPTFVITGHHFDDQLETRVHRLVRGTGMNGLRGMQECDGWKLRPALELTRAQLRELATAWQLNWLEDPTNQDPRYFRNWLRHKWLVDLEHKMPGASRSLMRSLEQILGQLKDSEHIMAQVHFDKYQGGWTWSWHRWHQLNHNLKSKFIHSIMPIIGVRDIRQSQIREIVRQLDCNKDIHQFNCLGQIWKKKFEQASVQNGALSPKPT